MIRKGSFIWIGLLFTLFLLLLIRFFPTSSTVLANTNTDINTNININSNPNTQLHMNRTVIVLPLDYVKWEDFSDIRYSGFQLLMKKGSIGLMNTNTKFGHERWSEYASMATGEPIRFFPPHWIVAPSPRSGNLANQATGSLAAILDTHAFFNKHTGFGFPLGELAESIKNFGYFTWYIGSQQTSKQVLDPAQLFVIEKNQVEKNQVFQIARTSYTIPNALAPYGMVDNIDRIVHDVKEILRSQHGGLLSIGLGDMARVNSEKDYLNPLLYERFRREAISKIDRLLLELLPSLPPSSTLIVTGIPPNMKSTVQDSLVPAAIVGHSFAAGGLLTSPTTHRLGLIASVDLAPTILSQFGIQHPYSLGNSVMSEPIHRHNDRIRLNNQVQINAMKEWNSWYTVYRPTWIRTIALFTVFTLTICLYVKWRIQQVQDKQNQKVGPRIVTCCLYLCIGVSLLPTLFMLEAPIVKLLQFDLHLQSVSPQFLHGGVLILLFLAVTYPAVYWCGLWNTRLLYTSAITVIIQVNLLLFHSGTFSQSFFGYDPVNGARYYGIGNEYMAGLVTAELLLLASSFMVSKKSLHWFHYVGACVFVVMLAAPNIGANMGGAITAAIGNAALLYRLRRGGWDRFGFIVCIGAATVTICCILVLHAIPSLYQTHTNKILLWIGGSHWHPIYQILLQKVQLNARMMFVQPVWLLFGGIVVSLASWILKYQATSKQYPFTHPIVPQLVRTILWTALVGFLTNDSGLVVVVLMIYSPLCLAIAWYVSSECNIKLPPIKERLRIGLHKRALASSTDQIK